MWGGWGGWRGEKRDTRAHTHRHTRRAEPFVMVESRVIGQETGRGFCLFGWFFIQSQVMFIKEENYCSPVE